MRRAKSLLSEMGMPFSDRVKEARCAIDPEFMSTVTDPIADLIARLRNGAQAQKIDMFVPYSRIKAEVVRILKEEGYISDYAVDTRSGPSADQDHKQIGGPFQRNYRLETSEPSGVAPLRWRG